MHSSSGFDERQALKNLTHFLPAQAPLKDFVHHNTLHEFQHLKFHQGITTAANLFGCKVYLSLSEYQDLYQRGKIKASILLDVFTSMVTANDLHLKYERLFEENQSKQNEPTIGKLRSHWKKQYHFDLNARVHSNLFRFLSSFLDQGISGWKFPVSNKSFFEAIKELDQKSYRKILRTSLARKLFHDPDLSITKLLEILVEDVTLFEHYLFDQQFEHPGWSGLVAVIEAQPHTLLDKKSISLEELIKFELLLEIDTLTLRFGSNWMALAKTLTEKPAPLFETQKKDEYDLICAIWHEAFEWTYYDEVVKSLITPKEHSALTTKPSFQVFFCIDDRESSLRSYLENLDTQCQTFGTPGFFGVDAYYEPEGGKFHTKICPLPVNPRHIIREEAKSNNHKKEVHFHKRSHHLFGGWLISQTVGFWSALKLFLNIFKPSHNAITNSSFSHMNDDARLIVEHTGDTLTHDGLQVGYTAGEMADRVEAVLRSTGLTNNFSDLIYLVGHGASSTNNTHFAAYDCGACCGRPGSVNARAFSVMANHPQVRLILANRGIHIPGESHFVGALHDTTCDEIKFYDEHLLGDGQAQNHRRNITYFDQALQLNAKERSRRFDLVNTKNTPASVHKHIKSRAHSLFETRPEYNHATNTVCIVGRRNMTKDLFLDRRAFLNSYDPIQDKDGTYLKAILNAAAPVCGGINLEYFFSRVDNQKLGAGSKLSHNVMGLIGVANGVEGDLRPGLPQQMIEIHDPLRLLMVVEQNPDIVMKVIQANPSTYQWFINEWIHLIIIDPMTQKAMRFIDGAFLPYVPGTSLIPIRTTISSELENCSANLPVFIYKPKRA